jgi:thioredoxin 1
VKTNLIVVVVVLVLVGGVAWFRSVREAARVSTAPPTAAPVADPVGRATTAPAQKGELCPDSPALVQAGDTPSSSPAPAAPSSAAPAKKLPRVVDLGATGCQACKQLAPILEELKKEYEGRVFVEFIDVWKNPKAGEPYKIRAIPTQVFFDAEGKEVWRHEGFLPKADFIARFAELGVQ